MGTMTEIKMLTIRDPKVVRIFAAMIASSNGINYVTHSKKGKPTQIDLILDVEDENEADMLRALM